MTPVTIISEWLQSIPPQVRKYVLLTYALAVAIAAILAVLGLDLDFSKINAVLAIIGGYLGIQSAANVPARGEGARRADVEPDRPPVAPEENPNAR